MFTTLVQKAQAPRSECMFVFKSPRVVDIGDTAGITFDTEGRLFDHLCTDFRRRVSTSHLTRP